MKIYKIGIIGCGGIAQKMAATLEKMKGRSIAQSGESRSICE